MCEKPKLCISTAGSGHGATKRGGHYVRRATAAAQFVVWPAVCGSPDPDDDFRLQDDDREREDVMTTAPITQRVEALKSLTEKIGLVTEQTVADFERETHDNWVPQNGALLVARAWTDPAFKSRLLADGRSAAAEFGIRMPEHHRKLSVRENLVDSHNIICCTLCSCTAVTIVGMAPGWYKDLEYRARIVRESRTVLREMGLTLPDSMTVQVWDTTADTRYMVLPYRPPVTAGWSEESLRELVTQDAMIGVARLEFPYGADIQPDRGAP